MHIDRTIRQLRTRAHLKQGEVAKAIGVDQSTISLWENARTEPELDKISQLAKLFGVAEQVFFDGLPDQSQSEEQQEAGTPFDEDLKDAYVHATSLEHLLMYANQTATVPLVSFEYLSADAHTGEELGKSVEVLPSLLRDHPYAQAVRVEDDCMSRVAPSGSIAVFDPDLQPSNGRVALVETAEHQAVMRRWHKGASTLLLEADSYQHFDDIVVTGNMPIRVIGTVVRVLIPDAMLA